MRLTLISSALALASTATAAVTAQQMTANIDAITEKVIIAVSLKHSTLLNNLIVISSQRICQIYQRHKLLQYSTCKAFISMTSFIYLTAF